MTTSYEEEWTRAFINDEVPPKNAPNNVFGKAASNVTLYISKDSMERHKRMVERQGLRLGGNALANSWRGGFWGIKKLVAE